MALSAQALLTPAQQESRLAGLHARPKVAATRLSAIVRNRATFNATVAGPVDPLAYGRALVETVGQRVAAVLAPENVLAEIGKANEEFTSAVRELQEEVVARAEGSSQEPQLPAPMLPLPGRQAGAARAGRQKQADLQALVDNLRADIAATRAVLQQIKQQQQGESKARG